MDYRDVLILLMFGFFFNFFSTVASFLTLILISLILKYISNSQYEETKINRKLYEIESLSSCPNPQVSGVIPYWLKYPDSERARYINHFISILWDPHLKIAIENKILSKVEWKLEILKSKVKSLSHISIECIDLGSSPPLISSIKARNQECQFCKSHIKHDSSDCTLKSCDYELSFIMDTNNIKLILSVIYKKIKASVILNKLQISGDILLSLSDFVNVIPGFSKYTISFLNYPKIDFELTFKTGSIKVHRLPKVSKILEPFLKRTLWKNFIYPENLSFILKKTEINNLRNRGKLIKYGQISSQSEGSIMVSINSLNWGMTMNKAIDYSLPLSLITDTQYVLENNHLSWFCLVTIKGSFDVFKTSCITASSIIKKLVVNQSYTFNNINLFDTDFKYLPILEILIFFLGKDNNEIIGQISVNLHTLIKENGNVNSNYKAKVYKFINSQDDPRWKHVGMADLNIYYMPPTNIKFRKLRSYVSTHSRKNKYDLSKIILDSIDKNNIPKLKKIKSEFPYSVKNRRRANYVSTSNSIMAHQNKEEEDEDNNKDYHSQ